MDYIIKLLWIPVLMIMYLFGLNSILSLPDTNLAIKSYIIQSGSMEPTIMTGDVILINVRPHQVKTGDIITFRDPKDRVITHRVLKIIDASGTEQIFTKGDNNQSADPFAITGDRIIGKYLYRVPKLGLLLVQFHKPIGSVSLVITVLALAFLPDLLKDKSPAKA